MVAVCKHHPRCRVLHDDCVWNCDVQFVDTTRLFRVYAMLENFSKSYCLLAITKMSSSFGANKNLYQQPAQAAPPFRFATYNIDCSVREEKVEETRFCHRSDQIAALVDDLGADIVCLQELRHLDGNLPPRQWIQQQFGHKYAHELVFRNAGKYAFGVATLFDDTKFDAHDRRVVWFSDTPDKPSDEWEGKFGANAMFVALMPKQNNLYYNGSSRFWVINTHFLLDETIKTRSCELLIQKIGEICRDEPFILCGDLNFFPDKDADKQRGILSTIATDVGGQDRGMKSTEGRMLLGTFVGYEHDLFHAPLRQDPETKTVDTSKMISRLDHIWISPKVCCMDEHLTVVTKTMKSIEPQPELSDRQALPSDHLPLFGHFCVL